MSVLVNTREECCLGWVGLKDYRIAMIGIMPLNHGLHTWIHPSVMRSYVSWKSTISSSFSMSQESDFPNWFGMSMWVMCHLFCCWKKMHTLFKNLLHRKNSPVFHRGCHKSLCFSLYLIELCPKTPEPSYLEYKQFLNQHSQVKALGFDQMLVYF